MSDSAQDYVVDRMDADDFEPMMVDGEQIGEAHWLRSAGSHDNAHEACLWRTDAPARYDYLFTGDESFCVLEGSVTIDLIDSGETVQLSAGDIASFDKGTRSVWTFTEPFKKFTVISE